MPFSLTPTKLNFLEECPKCFWLSEVAETDRPSFAFPSLPSGMDRVLKKHFDSFRGQEKLPPELEKEGLKARLFEDIELMHKWRAPQSGLRFKEPESGALFKGAVDEVLCVQDKVAVLDFKTRSTPPTPQGSEWYQTQLDSYHFLLEQNGFECLDRAFLLYYYPSHVIESGHVAFDTMLVEVPVNPRNAERLFHRALDILNGPLPDPSLGCGFCAYKQMR